MVTGSMTVPIGRLEGEILAREYLNGRILGNTSSPLAEVADSEASGPHLSVYAPGYGPKIPGKW